MQKKRILQIGIGLCVIISILALSCASGLAPNVTNTTSKYGGILKRSWDSDGNILGDPVPRPYNLGGFRSVLTAIETLFRYNEKGVPVPWLATGWKASPDLTSITITLQKGVKFHDGTVFDAEACKWNLERYRISANPELKAVKSIDIVDDFTVRLNLSEWNNLIIDNLCILPGMMISPTAYQKAGSTDKERSDWAQKNPVGTGPFQFVSWQRDVKQVYKKFDGYWQKGKPYLDGIEWYIISDNMIRVAAFKRGEVDETNIDAKDAYDLKKENKYDIAITDNSVIVYCLVGDSKNPKSPFADIRVRRAVDYAIDKKKMSDALCYSIIKLTNQSASPINWGYNPDVKGYPYDPDKAKQLLAEAGYPNGFKTKIISPNFGAFFAVPAPVIQEYLRKVGIIADIELATQLLHKKYTTEGFKDSLIGYPANLSLPDTTRDIVLDFSSKANLASSMLLPDDYTAALNNAQKASDFENKKKWTWEAQRLLTDKYALANFFFSIPYLWVISKDVHDTGIGKTTSFHWTPEDAWIEK